MPYPKFSVAKDVNIGLNILKIYYVSILGKYSEIILIQITDIPSFLWVAKADFMHDKKQLLLN